MHLVSFLQGMPNTKGQIEVLKTIFVWINACFLHVEKIENVEKTTLRPYLICTVHKDNGKVIGM